jgi:hypothetical protein
MRGQERVPPHHRGEPTSTRNWLKHTNSKPSLRRSTTRCGCFEPPSSGKPLRGERARELGKQARECINVDFDVDNPNMPPRHCCGPCLLPQHPRRGTCTARRKHSLSKRPYSRPRAWRPAFANRGARRTTGVHRAVHAGGVAERPANPGRTPVREQILDTRGHVQDGDARIVINARRTGNTETRAAAGYHP